MRGIKYYSNSDMSIGYNLKQAEKVLKGFDNSKKYNINKLLEFYNVIIMINENKLYLDEWKVTQIAKYNELCRKMEAYLVIELKRLITDNSLNFLYEKVDIEYKEDLISVIDKYEIYKNLNFQSIEKILDNNKDYTLSILLKYKKIVSYWDNELAESLKTNKFSAIILLDKYVVETKPKSTQIYIPKSLLESDKEHIINSYIRSDEVNLNYLEAIINSKNCSDFKISDKLKLMAKRKYEKEIDKFFDENIGYEYGCNVSFVNNQKESVKFESFSPIIKVKYSINWIKENLDYPTLLNNFIYLFEYCDKYFRIQLISKSINLGIFEKHLRMKTKNEYITGVTFNLLNMLSQLQLVSYYNVLNKQKIRLEVIIEWFFSSYLKNQFGISNYIINMPSPGSNYLEKCRSVASEIDTIVKSYTLYIENKEIDTELLEITSTHLFFSDQCMLRYTERTRDKKYRNFYELINSEKVTREDIVLYELENLDYLLKNKYIIEREEGIIKILDVETVLVIKDLVENEFINYWRCSLKLRNRINELLDEGVVYEECSLFSKQEVDYFNYYLNNSEYGNALALRNKYLHGVIKGEDVNSSIHKQNYFIFLKIVILIIIKINDDLCIYDEITSKTNS